MVILTAPNGYHLWTSKTEEKVILDVAIVDVGNNLVTGSIQTEIRGTGLTIHDEQKIIGCTPLIFNMHSFEASQNNYLCHHSLKKAACRL